MIKTQLIFQAIIFLLLLSQIEAIQAQPNLEKLHDYIETLQENDKFMGSIAIRDGNDVLYQQAEGWAYIKDSIPITQETKFRIGSVTKMFTAVMTFQMIQEKALSLNTTLDRFYPDIPLSDKITIDMLLSHRSGIHNFTDDPDYLTYMTVENSKEVMLLRIIEKGSDFTPDSTTQYSNANYVLLGYILEEVSGKSYSKLLEERITKPLGLSSTYLEDSTEIDKNECYSYRHTGKNWYQHPETHMSIPHGAGAIVSTPAELTHFIRSLFHLELIHQESLDKMMALQDKTGRGIFRYIFEEIDTAYGHGGAIDAFHTTLQYFPEQDVAISICTNGVNYRLSQIVKGVTNIYFNKAFELPDFDQLESLYDSTHLVKFTGHYITEKFPLDITLSMKNNQLYGQATGQMSFPLNWESVNILTYPAANISLNFKDSEMVDGKYQSFLFTQGSSEFKYERKIKP